MRALIIAAVLLAGCASAQPVNRAELPEHIRMDLEQRDAALAEPGVVAAGIGETADLGGGLRVQPLEVLEDSRCPQDARCVWGGRLRLRVDIEGVGRRELSLDGFPVETPHGALTLVAVSPGPWAGWPQDRLPPYRFGFSKS